MASYDPHEIGGNAAKEAIQEIELYVAALGRHVRDARPSLVVTRGESLRQLLVAQDNQDIGFIPLLQKHLLQLRKIVSSHNIYVALDPELARRDSLLLGPDAVFNLVDPPSGTKVIEDAVEKNVATERVVDRLSSEAKVTPKIPSKHNRNSQRYTEGIKNFVRAALAKLGSALRNPYGTSVTITAAVIAIAKWLLAHEAWLLSTFEGNSTMLYVIRYSIDIARKMPL